MMKLSNRSIFSALLILCLVIQLIPVRYSVIAAENDARWIKYSANSAYNGEFSADESGAVMSGRSASYYSEAITVKAGTKISVDVMIPAIAEGKHIQYAFGLTTGTNSFYNADSKAVNTTMVTEFTGLGTADNLTASGAIRLPGGERSVRVAAKVLTKGRSNITSAKYNIVFEKQESTSDYSWVITAKEMSENGNTVSINISKTDIADDIYADGAYFIVGALNGEANSIKISNPAVIQPSDSEHQEDENSKWEIINGMTSGGILEESSEFNGDAVFENKVAAYYKEKIVIKENTSISFSVKFKNVSSTELLHYGFSLVDTEGSFYTSNNDASSLSAELQSNSSNKRVVAVASNKIAPNTGRKFLANIGILSNERNTSDEYRIEFKKINETVGDDNYSWEIITTNLATEFKASYRIKSSEAAQDMFENGAYLAVGVMNGNGYSIEVSDITFSTWEDEPETAWKAIRGYESMDFKTSTNDAVTLNGGKGGAYRAEPFSLKSNMSITLEYEAKSLTLKNSNDFYVMFLNQAASLANGADDRGSGYAIQLRTSADYSTFTLFLREVANGKMGNDTTDSELKFSGGVINASALNQKIKITLTRRMQTLDGVEYYGSITVNVNGKDYTKKITSADADRVFGDIDENLYLSAGSFNNVNNIMEISNIQISELPVVVSVDGLWKPIFGYSAETLSAIVNDNNCVSLYGQGAACLEKPLLTGTNSSVSVSLQLIRLESDYNNKFSFAILNQKNSFIGETASGTGFVLEFRSFDKYEKGYAVYIGQVINGKVEEFEKIEDSIILDDMSKSKFNITFTRKNSNSWKIEVIDSTCSKTLSYNIDNCKELEALKPGSIYLSAGNVGMDLDAVVGY